MKLSPILSGLLIAGLALSSVGCAKNKKGSNMAGVDGDYVNSTPLPERQEGVSFMSPNVDRAKFKPVHFAFDSFSVEGSERPRLDQVADFLKGASNTVIIAGFTDERGTAEYNRALGERRAEAVRQYSSRPEPTAATCRL